MQAKVRKVNDGEGQVLLTYRKLVADNGNKKLEDAFNNQELSIVDLLRLIIEVSNFVGLVTNGRYK